MKKSFLCVMLCILMILPLLVACGDPEQPQDPSGTPRPDGPTGSPATEHFLTAELNVPTVAKVEFSEAGALAAACTHNAYLYFAQKDANGQTKLCRRDLQSDALTEGPAADLGNAVSMCYDPQRNCLVIAHGNDALSLADPETLTVTETYATSGTVEAITYLPGESCYGVRFAGKRNLVLLDNSFAQIRILSLSAAAAGCAVVDMTADSEYIYFLTEVDKKATVYIYHIESKQCLQNTFSFDMKNRTLSSISFNGADFLVGTTSFILNDVFYSGALVSDGESKLANLVARTLERGVDSDGINAEMLFKIYRLANDLGANNVMQGGCTDGRYGYFCMEDQAGNYEDTSLHRTCIVKVDMATGELVDVSERLPLHHSNDMCYNPNTNQLMVVHCGKGDNAYGLTYVDPDTLEITGTASLPIGFYCMAYDEVNDRYMVGSNGRNFSILDSDFNVLVPKVNVGPASYCKEEELITQGSDCDSEYVYVVLGGRNSSGPWVNYLVVYDWNGELIMAKIIPGMTAESENIFHIGSTIYVACNGEDEPVYKIDLLS